jgi:hypothetical protein
VSEEWEPQSLDLSHKELLSLYILLTKHESQLDNTQRVILRRVCDHVYRRLSVEQLEDAESFYESL